MKKLELVFVPVLASGHLTSAAALAKRLLDRHERLSITFLLIPLVPSPTYLDPYTNLLAATDDRIKFTIIQPTLANAFQSSSKMISIEKLATDFFETHKSHVEQAVMELISDDSTQLVGFVLDMFTSCLIDVAKKLNVPSYIFFASNASFLGFLLHLPIRHNQVGTIFHPTDPDSIIPTYRTPLPAHVLPTPVFDKTGGGYEAYLYLGTKFPEANGIIVNSFVDLEPYAVDSIIAPPTVYPVGPLINHKTQNKSTSSIEIKNWLDHQPSNSVLFLCFGSHRSLNKAQLEQIAIALERSDHRFLWSVRKPPPEDSHESPSDYTDVQEALPDGFLSRVEGRGLLCGWAPQVEVLAHGAVKGFVSHCGWNSILESLWYGVPIATWPLAAEQQVNAFWLVKEVGLAVELSLAYRSGGSELVMADQIEGAIDWLMDDRNDVRERVKEMSEQSRKATTSGGSSFVTLGKLIEDMVHNIGDK